MRTLTLTNAQIVEVCNALGAIDAGYLATVDGKTTARHFRFSGATTLRIATLGVALKPAFKAYDKANAAIFRAAEPIPTKISDDATPELRVPPERYLEYKESVAQLLDAAVEVTVPPLCIDDLAVGESKDGKNPIPPGAIAGLDPVLDGGVNKQPKVKPGEEA